MSIKTILVHLADDEDHRTRLRVAMRLAVERGAHLVALFIASPIGMPDAVVGRAASAGYLAEATRIAREKARKLEREFQEACKSENITGSWVTEEGDHLELLERHAHLADLAIVSQYRPQHLEDRFRLLMPEELMMVSGCPVLLLPRGCKPETIGRNVMIAWKSMRETVRAVRGALPFLQSADSVAVVSLGDEGRIAVSLQEVGDYLKRHGIEADLYSEEAPSGDLGEALLAHARKLGADLVVMGAYGHSRLREMMLGGVTRHVLRHTTLPVLMSH